MKSGVEFSPARGAQRLNNIPELHNLTNYLINNPQMFELAAEILIKCFEPTDVWTWSEEQIALGIELDYNLLGLIVNVLGVRIDGNRINIGEIRGKIVEKYLMNLLLNFTDTNDGKIYNRHYVSYNGWTSKKEIDVLYWKDDNTCGEFFECKMSVENVKPPEKHEEYLDNLYDILNRLHANTLIGITSFQMTNVCKCFLQKYINDKRGVQNYLVIGRDRLNSSIFSRRWSFPRGVAF